ncbi:MAG: cyclic nucleotide-binding domain-containing protein [Burkholderiales bacterium]
MGQEDQKFPSEVDKLGRFERIAANAEVTEELGTLLGRAPLFSEFTREDVRSLAEYMGVYRAPPSETIIREGDVGDFMLLIIRGEVDILKRGFEREQQHMTSVGAGTTIGEMSMIDGEPRFATCRTTQATTFAVLTRDNMAKIILEQPQLGSKILVKLVTMLSARLRQTSAKLMRYMEGVH